MGLADNLKQAMSFYDQGRTVALHRPTGQFPGAGPISKPEPTSYLSKQYGPPYRLIQRTQPRPRIYKRELLRHRIFAYFLQLGAGRLKPERVVKVTWRTFRLHPQATTVTTTALYSEEAWSQC